MDFRKLTLADSKSLDELIDVIESTLEREVFWLPINATAKEHFFDPSWTEFYGFFDGPKLVAAAALFYNEHEYKESVAELDMEDAVFAEIGRAMVHPDYRGNHYLYQINQTLIEVARTKNIQYLLATIHPDNIPSQKSFLKSGFEKKHTYRKSNGYERDIFLLQLKERAL